jgi:hypothetical protein
VRLSLAGAAVSLTVLRQGVTQELEDGQLPADQLRQRAVLADHRQDAVRVRACWSA